MKRKLLRLSVVPLCAVTLLFFATAHKGIAATTHSACEVPQGLRAAISSRFPGTSVVSLSDLTEYERRLFQRDHGGRCPGSVRVDFYGDGQPTWALALLDMENSRRNVQLVLARELGKKWNLEVVDSVNEVAVLWVEKPGEYRDTYGEKTIRATHDAVVFCGYGSWAILYAWTGKDIQKVWISD